MEISEVGGITALSCARAQLAHTALIPPPTSSGAFAIYDLKPTNTAGLNPSQEGDCTGPSFDPAQLPADVVTSLSCIFAAYSSSSALGWASLCLPWRLP